MKEPFLKVRFPEARFGYWDGGVKEGGEFHVQSFSPEHPGKNITLTWGCWALNFWFNCGSGRSWKEAAAIAARRLKHLCKVVGTKITIEWDTA